MPTPKPNKPLSSAHPLSSQPMTAWTDPSLAGAGGGSGASSS